MRNAALIVLSLAAPPVVGHDKGPNVPPKNGEAPAKVYTFDALDSFRREWLDNPEVAREKYDGATLEFTMDSIKEVGEEKDTEGGFYYLIGHSGKVIVGIALPKSRPENAKAKNLERFGKVRVRGTIAKYHAKEGGGLEYITLIIRPASIVPAPRADGEGRPRKERTAHWPSGSDRSRRSYVSTAPASVGRGRELTAYIVRLGREDQQP